VVHPLSTLITTLVTGGSFELVIVDNYFHNKFVVKQVVFFRGKITALTTFAHGLSKSYTKSRRFQPNLDTFSNS